MSRYAISDLHGRYDLYQEVKKFLKSNDTVICLGDCGDRGSGSWETIKSIASDPQFKYFMGNHEHLLAHAMKQYIDGMSLYYVNALQDCVDNGGLETLNEWIDNGANRGWIKYLLNLEKATSFENESGITIMLSHAGFTPGKEIDPSYDLIWDREHLKDEWPRDKKWNNTLIVHGHTPVQFIKPNSQSAIWYANTHKIDIDCGSVWSGRACLLDLDTLDEHYFDCGPTEDDFIEEIVDV